MSDLFQLNTDSLALLGHANKLLNVKRKEHHQPDLGHEYFHLSSPSVPFTEFLYGDDLSKSVNEIQDINRVGKRLGQNPGSFRGNPRGHFNYRGRGRAVLNRLYNQSNWGRWTPKSGHYIAKKDQSKNFKDRSHSK